ncbi:hypothetical protein GCK72_000455 [Caenorhabditis remanei]|nr:hypothetical protein GCK72_000455 [Caenorhabditis remanei]KAF1768643.1 hypothetical protein GCK72_000455 [Caenorhabditis remanei]
MSHVDRYDMNKGESEKERKRSRSRKAPPTRSTIDNRPPWNNDTYIEGYEDVDEHGKFRKRGGGMPKTNDRQQEELTKNWTESLRDKHHQPQK